MNLTPLLVITALCFALSVAIAMARAYWHARPQAARRPSPVDSPRD